MTRDGTGRSSIRRRHRERSQPEIHVGAPLAFERPDVPALVGWPVVDFSLSTEQAMWSYLGIFSE